MSENYKAPTPCDKLTEPFFTRGYCVACGWLAELHTTEGWRDFHMTQARNCQMTLDGLKRRVEELRVAVAEAQATATHPPHWTPFAETGYISVHVPREFPTP